MRQNLVSLELTAADIARLDEAIATIEELFTPFISLSAKQVRSLTKMGDKSEFFCRQTVRVLEQNPEILPPTFDLSEVQRDIAAFDLLRSRLLRLEELAAKGRDTGMALGSDILTAALEGYALVKLFGKSEGLETLRQAMALRRPPRRKASDLTP
ncbi:MULTISPECIES: hypothetical protein [Zoogloea]|jgi:hypothetical protein|uniref:Uncharacterized protein n=1 Tax=Zoogloea oleivorans TaxID=1552750 RepID=A0A6C2CKB0_9RHOO|nr:MULTISPECIES: hypothetical protein [Zoogloea]MBP8133882.1 hypothetical protein [Zoogloea sp.]MDD2668313.1 hypothetical protein [Zoogloea sp.]MDY0037301.1 hypothetical protein [Zoogloea oleivorans]TYC54278.1 hypothetical protein ETQ85_19570 [Zoogloea oleivorans]